MGEFERMKEFNMKFSMEELQKSGFGGFLSQAESKFSGGADKLSQSAKGLMSTISDNIWTSFRKMGAGAFEMLKPELQKIVAWFDGNQDTIKNWVDIGSKALSGFISGVMWVVNAVVTNWPMIQSVISQVSSFVQPILSQLLGLFMMIASWVVANMPTFQAAIAEVMRVIAPAIQTVIDVLGILWDAWTKAWPTISRILMGAWGVIKPAISLIINIIGLLGEIFKQVFPYILDIVNGVWGFLEPIFGKIGEAIGWIADRVGDLKKWLGGKKEETKKATIQMQYNKAKMPDVPKIPGQTANVGFNLPDLPKDQKVNIDFAVSKMPDIPEIPPQTIDLDYGSIPPVPDISPAVNTEQVKSAAGAFDSLKDAVSGSMKFLSDHDTAFKAVGATITAIFLPGIISAVTQLGALTGAFIANTASLIAHTAASAAETIALKAMYMWDGLVAAAQWLYNNSIFAGMGAMLSYGMQLAILGAQLLWMKIQQVAVAIAQGAWNAIVGIATALQWLWNAALTANPIGLIILGIAALIGIIVLLVTHWDWVKQVAVNCWNTVMGWIKGAPDWLLAIIAPLLLIVKHWDDVKAAALGFWDAIVKTFSNIGQWFKNNVIDPLLGIVPDWLKKFFGGGSVSVKATSNSATLVSDGVDGSHASGLSYVPFDNYIARLHKGERVLTASENRDYGSRGQTDGAGGNKTISKGGNTFIFNVNGVNKNARELVEEMFQLIQEASDTMGEVVIE